MNKQAKHYTEVAAHYDRLASNGPFATLAPHNRGGRKGEYVAAVFDAAVMSAMDLNATCDSLLDFGCGTGIFLRRAASLAKHVVGVDVSQGMLDTAASVCRGLPNVTLMQTQGERLELPDESFDCVVARESLCYVSDERLPAVLSEIARVLKPGGVFYWLDQVSNSPNWQRHPKAPHLVKRSPELLRQFALSAGLPVVAETVVRNPRFPWIYVVWFGLVPRAWTPRLAGWEVAWHRRAQQAGRRWWNALFVLRKPL